VGGRQGAHDLVERFNASQSEYRVHAQFSGSYAEALTRAIAALRTGQAPNILQVYEVGTQTMLDSGAIIPVYELAESRGGIDFGDISRPIFNYYAVDGKLYSMPFNSSTAMLYYNKDIFRKAGLDPNRPPTTFDEVLEMGRQIVASGAAPHAISFGWPAWVFEQAHATHNQFYANNANGRAGRATEVLFNGPPSGVDGGHPLAALGGGGRFRLRRPGVLGQPGLHLRPDRHADPVHLLPGLHRGGGQF